MTSAVRIGNCSGFYGDRLAAMREMLTGGDLDYLTGDYLAELTMLILARDRAKSPDRGYAKTFLTQLEECLGTRAGPRCADRRQRRRAEPRRAGRTRCGRWPTGSACACSVAHVEGDDLLPRPTSSGSARRWRPTPTSGRGASSTA